LGFLLLRDLPRTWFIPPDQNSSPGLFARAGLRFPCSCLSTEAAESLGRTILFRFLFHPKANIRNRLRIYKHFFELCFLSMAGVLRASGRRIREPD